MQFRVVSKEEAHRLIDKTPGNTVMVLTYNGAIGLSDHGRYMKKKRSKKLVDKYPIVILAENRPVTTLNLQKIESRISKSIIIQKLE